ncbi:MAG TPA: GreA/GreB family elongation factor [Polyangiaceae bacterium]|nr:GreA/GreB family elongation factor [Polyangiaceae bacterium]
MSRAFVKEESAQPPLVVPRAPLPADVPNYVTRRGLSVLHAERAELAAVRPSLDGGADGSALAAHQARLGALDARIASAVLLDTSTLAQDEVRFSALVTLADASDNLRRYRIVGVDEAEPESGRIAFTAPLARQLMGKRLGDVVLLRTTRGETELEIIAIDYTQE